MMKEQINNSTIQKYLKGSINDISSLCNDIVSNDTFPRYLRFRYSEYFPDVELKIQFQARAWSWRAGSSQPRPS